MTSSGLAIEAEGLVKVFGKETRAVDGVDLSVASGGVYGFLGPNGAGKTTTIRMLATLVPPTGGTARVFGHDIVHEANAVRRRVSLTGQFASVDEDLTGTENLMLLGKLLGFSRSQALTRAYHLLGAFGLEDAAGRQVKKYSGGMRRRLDIAASIIISPDLIFLDEPTTGLDPRSRSQVWDIVRALVAEGTTVLLTTQYLEEADRLADRIAVLDGGDVVAEGTSVELKERVAAQRLDLVLSDAVALDEATRVLDGRVVYRDAHARTLGVATDGSAAHVRSLLDEVDPRRSVVERFTVQTATLDDVFLALTGHVADEQKETADV